MTCWRLALDWVRQLSHFVLSWASAGPWMVSEAPHPHRPQAPLISMPGLRGGWNPSLPSAASSLTRFAESHLHPRGVQGPRRCLGKCVTGIGIVRGLCSLFMSLWCQRGKKCSISSLSFPRSKILTAVCKSLVQRHVSRAGSTTGLTGAFLEG